MKKFTLTICENKEIEIHDTNSLKYVRKILLKKFYTSDGIPTTALINATWTIRNNKNNKRVVKQIPDSHDIAANNMDWEA